MECLMENQEERTAIERELNRLIEVTMKMEYELQIITQKK